MTDTELRRRFASLTDAADDANWLEVARRARELHRPRHTRPALLLVATLAVGVLIAAPAIALRGHIVRAFDEAPTAPQKAASSISSDSERAGG